MQNQTPRSSNLVNQLNYSNAGYTPQDNRADFGPISPLPTILGNYYRLSIILVVLKIIFSDFPVVWGVLRVTESAQKNVGGAPITNMLNIYDTEILLQKTAWTIMRLIIYSC